MLQQSKTERITDPRAYLTLVHGQAGIGKTSWAAQQEGHYFVSTEPGTKGLSVYGEECSSWKTFLDIGQEIAQGRASNWDDGKQREIKVLVVDTADRLWDLCGAHIARTKSFMIKGSAQQYEDVRHVPYGAGYSATTEEFLRVLIKLQFLGIGVTLLSHTHFERIKWGTEEFRRAGPDLYTTDTIVGACDAVGYFDIEEKVTKQEVDGKLIPVAQGQRVQWWQPQFLRVAKHRLEGFPEKLLLPANTGYQVYLDAFTTALERGTPDE